MAEENNQKNEDEYAGMPIPKLRTYKGDVTDALASQKQSLTQLILAHRKREATRDKTVIEGSQKLSWNKNTIFIALGVLFFALALGIILVFTFFSKKNTITTRVPITWNIIFAESQQVAPLSQFRRFEIQKGAQQALNAPIPFDSIREVYFTKQIAAAEGVQERLISSAELLRSLEGNTSEQLIRTLKPEYSFGVHSLTTTEPFLILKTGFYDGAFLGILEWEPFMLNDLKPLFSPKREWRGLFEDLIVRNTDARVLKDDRGETLLIYTFPDRETIVITTKSATLGEILERLKAPRDIVR